MSCSKARRRSCAITTRWPASISAARWSRARPRPSVPAYAPPLSRQEEIVQKTESPALIAQSRALVFSSPSAGREETLFGRCGLPRGLLGRALRLGELRRVEQHLGRPRIV